MDPDDRCEQTHRQRWCQCGAHCEHDELRVEQHKCAFSAESIRYSAPDNAADRRSDHEAGGNESNCGRAQIQLTHNERDPKGGGSRVDYPNRSPDSKKLKLFILRKKYGMMDPGTIGHNAIHRVMIYCTIFSISYSNPNSEKIFTESLMEEEE